jgi:sterol desaturase/sphingolipid hydroxylase (fatty acid hydroxylase superfamily)
MAEPPGSHKQAAAGALANAFAAAGGVTQLADGERRADDELTLMRHEGPRAFVVSVKLWAGSKRSELGENAIAEPRLGVGDVSVLHAFSLADLMSKLGHHLLSFDSIIVLATWASALIGAALTFAIRTDRGCTRTFGNFLRFCFPSVLLHHKSVRLDLMYTVASRAVHPLTIGPVIVGNVVIAKLSYDGLSDVFGPQPEHMESAWLWAFILLVTVVIADGCNFLTHYAEHKVRPLWELHKVHHSTLFLIPLSNRRIHPGQEIIDAGLMMLGVGGWLGGMSYIFGLPIRDNMLLGMDAYFFANLLSFYHLRHSHISMSYGWLEYVFLSPAQHQLHHSVEEKHWDHNFGLLLACWDQMAGTFLRAEPKRDFGLGLVPDEQAQYTSLLRLYFVPPLNIARMGLARLAQVRRRAPVAEAGRPGLIHQKTFPAASAAPGAATSQS